MRTRLMPTGWFRRSITLLALAPAFLNAEYARSQTAQNDVTKHYSKDALFQLPISMEDKVRANIKEVQLWMKTGTNEWQSSQVAQPQQKSFKYKASADGEYCFALVTIDLKGTMKPSDLTRLSPNEIVRVIVDTQPPSIDLQPMKVANGELLLRCTVTDANPEPDSLKVSYFGPDQTLRRFEPVPGQPGMFRVPGSEVLSSPVRVTVNDLAKNVTTRDVNLRDAVAKLNPAPPPVATPVTTPTVNGASPAPITQVCASNLQASPSPLSTISTPPAPGGAVLPTPPPVSAGTAVQAIEPRPAPASVLPSITAAAGSAPRQLLNTKRASLDYRIDQIGPSGVSKVEVWMTPDQGTSWKRISEDADRRSPTEFDLPADGLYGVRVVVTNGNGFGGRPPVPGDEPQLWIEVDTQAPVAQLKEVEPVTNGGNLDIRWTVTDKNLSAEPINLFYATQREGPWQPIARGLKNDGLFRWSFPREAGSQFFVRLECVDLAGNLTKADTPNAIVLDMTIPRTSVVGVTGIPR